MKGRSLFARLRGGPQAAGRAGLGMDGRGMALVHLPPPGAEAPRATLRTLETSADTDPAEGLRRAVGELRLADCPCTLTLSPGDYQTFQIDKPPVEADELVGAARWRVRDLLDYPPDEAIIDVFEVPGQAQRGRPPSVMVVAARQSRLRERLDLIEAAGLVPERIDIAELALRNLVCRLGGPSETLATLFLGRDRGLIVITRGEQLYVARGMEHGLEDLRRELNPGGGELSLDGDAEGFYDRVALEVQRTMDYYDSYFGLGSVQRLLVAPGLAALDGLAERAGATLGLRAQRLDLGEVLPVDAPGEALGEGVLALGGVLRLPPREAAA